MNNEFDNRPAMGLPVVLSIAGSDSGGGAGIQADLLSFAANGVFGTTALTCVTAQNPGAVTAVQALEAELVGAQIDAVCQYFPVKAMKTGMLFNESIINRVAAVLEFNPQIPVVVDPVMVATSGAVLLEETAILSLKRKLLPKAVLITPNLDEALLLVDGEHFKKADVQNDAERRKELAQSLARAFGTACLLKGGHAMEASTVVDTLATPDGTYRLFEHPRRGDLNTHGSGCTLAAAVAAWLGRGKPLGEAVAGAIAYLQQGIRKPLRVGGEVFINHLPNPGPAHLSIQSNGH
jgi:hydroxymethylpyrimidine/phosphomethylpyrimidine kinase